MRIRKVPFGYTMHFGEIVLHPEESTCVRMIFQKYSQGASFNELVEYMKEHGTSYDDDKPWNKNMIARVLENERYTGRHPYPVIIPQTLFDAATDIRAKKQLHSEKTATQKLLRKLCDTRITPNIEHQVDHLLKLLSNDPELVQPPSPKPMEKFVIADLQKQLDAVLAQQPIDEAEARTLICALASSEYDSIDSSEYETERIRHLLFTLEPSESMNEILLQKCVDKIQVFNHEVRLVLKNGQIIERESLP